MDFRAAIDLDPKHILALYNLANVFLAKRQLRQALTLYDRACELCSRENIDDDLFNNRAICKVCFVLFYYKRDAFFGGDDVYVV